MNTKKTITPITDEEVYKMKLNSILFANNHPSGKGISAQAIKELLVNCVFGDKNSILEYLKRFMLEQKLVNSEINENAESTQLDITDLKDTISGLNGNNLPISKEENAPSIEESFKELVEIVNNYPELVPDQELDENSNKAISNKAVSDAIRSVNEVITNINYKVEGLTHTFTYSDKVEFLSSIELGTLTESNGTIYTILYSMKDVASNKVYTYDDLVIGSSVLIKNSNNPNTDYWLAHKKIEGVYSEKANQDLIKLTFFEQYNTELATDEDIKNLFN